jgi:hypothetical protein
MTDTMRKTHTAYRITKNKRKEREESSSQRKQYSQVITDYVKESRSLIKPDENSS